MKNIAIIILLCLTVGAFAQHEHPEQAEKQSTKAKPEFKDSKLGNAYTQYLALKDALVASDAKQAIDAAGKLEKSLQQIKSASKAGEAAKEIASSTNLEAQREKFSTLSNEMTALIKAAELTSGALYIAYCPMANNNAGASWLANEREINNPYFGDMMLRCGSVKETIE